MNNKIHFKMYKDGKKWAIMGISTAVLSGLMITGQQINAHADANNIQNTTTQLVSSKTSSNDVSTPDQPSSSTTSTNSVKADTNLSDISQHQQLGIIPVHADGSIDTNAQEQAKLDPNSIRVEEGQDLIKNSSFKPGSGITGTTDNHSRNYLNLQIDTGKLTSNNHRVKFTVVDDDINGMSYNGQPITRIVMIYTLDVDPTTARYYETTLSEDQIRNLIAANFSYINWFFIKYQSEDVTNPQEFYTNWFSDEARKAAIQKNPEDGSHDAQWKSYVAPNFLQDFNNLRSDLISKFGNNPSQEEVMEYLANHQDNAYFNDVKKQNLKKHSVGIQVFSNLSDGFYDEGIKDVTIKYVFYNNGQRINFKHNTAFLTVESLNHDTDNLHNQSSDHVETVKADSGADVMTLADSEGKIAKNSAGDTLYAPESNSSLPGIGQDETGRANWDKEGSPSAYLGAGVLNLDQDDVVLEFGMNPDGKDFWPSARFRFGSIAAAMPVTPTTPTTPTHNPGSKDEPTPTPKNDQPQGHQGGTQGYGPVGGSQAVKNTQTVNDTQETKSAQLPQTGDAHTTEIAALGLSALLMGLGLAGKRKFN